MLQTLSPVLALYDPFGVDVPLNCDTIIIITTYYKMPDGVHVHVGTP